MADAPAARWKPYVGLLGVMIGSMIATLGTRVTSFGLADLRGNLGLGFDEGAWITTAFGLGQLISGIASPYLSSVVGGRRMLLAGSLTAFFAFLLAPFSSGLAPYLTAEFFAGLGTGTFIPLTIMYIVRHLPRPLMPYGIAVYAMNLEISLNIAASLEGFYVDNWSWKWISWQYCLLLPLMWTCVLLGMPKDELHREALKRFDGIGLAHAWIGLGAFYVALDQGNRLDWTGSGLIVAMLIVGALSITAFVLRERTASHPALDLRLLASPHLWVLFTLLAGFRFIILSTAYVIPSYLETIQGYRGLDVGAVLIWIAAPQFFLVLPLGILIGRIDPRWTLGVGAMMIAAACLMATGLTASWATPDFLASQILQAVGQSMALTSLVALVLGTVRPEQAATVGALMQTSRLLGGEAGTAFMQTFVRVREQIHSNLLGLHVEAQAGETTSRIASYAHMLSGKLATASDVAAAKVELLATAVARQAAVLAYIDAFEAAAAVAVLCWLLAAFVPKAAPRA
ncbi:MAG: MFS transporter [Chelatococcus sp.]|nr:MAG: MFS transporter [Chelatococcus sp.]